MFRKIYLSRLGFFIYFLQNFIAKFTKPFMVYGYYCSQSKKLYKYTRISSSVKFTYKSRIRIENNVWIGHYCLIDGIGKVNISEGVNISSHTVIYSHSSHDSLRLLGKEYIKIPAQNRPGYKIKSVNIGPYTFIGTSVIILPGVNIGKGCIIGAGTVVNTDIPDFSIAVGNPVKIIGNTINRDKGLYKEEILQDRYYLNMTK